MQSLSHPSVVSVTRPASFLAWFRLAQASPNSDPRANSVVDGFIVRHLALGKASNIARTSNAADNPAALGCDASMALGSATVDSFTNFNL